MNHTQAFDLLGENPRAFLLRCWQEAGAGPGGRPAWRFRLINLDAQRASQGFAGIEDLMVYLRKELKIPGEPTEGDFGYLQPG